jgi:translation initiation factor 2 subunit 1
MATIARRLTPQPIKLRADIELTCYTPTGIEAIKKALRAGEKASTEAVPIKAKLVAPPLYVLSTNATDKVCDDVVGAHRVTLTSMTVCCGRAFRACH